MKYLREKKIYNFIKFELLQKYSLVMWSLSDIKYST